MKRGQNTRGEGQDRRREQPFVVEGSRPVLLRGHNIFAHHTFPVADCAVGKGRADWRVSGHLVMYGGELGEVRSKVPPLKRSFRSKPQKLTALLTWQPTLYIFIQLCARGGQGRFRDAVECRPLSLCTEWRRKPGHLLVGWLVGWLVG